MTRFHLLGSVVSDNETRLEVQADHPGRDLGRFSFAWLLVGNWGLTNGPTWFIIAMITQLRD